MELKVETRSWPGSGEGHVNEDFACADATRGCAVLVDGATGLTGTNLVVGETDASWYARHLARETLVRLTDEGMTAGEAMAAAGREVARAYGAMPGADALGRADVPNGSMAVVRWDDECLELRMLGDCTALVVGEDGAVEVVHDATLDALDAANYARMLAYATEHGVAMAEARRALNDWFVRNRLLINEPDGYWAADVSCAGFGHELVRRIAGEEAAHVVLLTDGFAACVQMGVVASYVELARRVVAGEGQALGEELRSAELADAGLWAHPRSKVSDDATYVLLSLG